MNMRLLSFVVAGSVFLGACAPTVETVRNDALEELEQMSGLLGTEREEVTLELNAASDVSSVERAMDKARRFQSDRLQRNKDDEDRKEDLAHFLASIEGKILTLTNPGMGIAECEGLQVNFRSGGIADLSNKPEGCFLVKDLDQIEWEVNTDEQDRHYGLVIDGIAYDEKMWDATTIQIRPSGLADPVIPPGVYEVR